jgi:hypothetical protein
MCAKYESSSNNFERVTDWKGNIRRVKLLKMTYILSSSSMQNIKNLPLI